MTGKAIPYLTFKDTAQAIEFYKKAFDAEEVYRLNEEDGRIGHAEITIQGAQVFLSDEFPEIGVTSAEAFGGTPIMVVLEVEDVDDLFHKAVDAGATVDRPLQDGFDGELRTAKVIDPFRFRWMILTRNEI